MDTQVNGDGNGLLRETVKVSGDMIPEPIESFSKMELRDSIMKNLEKMGYKEPTPTQQYVYPMLASNRDVIVCAQTGLGKSCAFLLVILNELMLREKITPALTMPAQPEAVILVPTRDLALQIQRESNLFANESMVKTQVIHSQGLCFAQRNQLKTGCNVLVATPDRMLQFLNDGHLVVHCVEFFILDEVDRMFEMGLMGDVNKVVEKLPPKNHRTSGIFTATFRQEIQDSAKNILNNYIFVTVGTTEGACKVVEPVLGQVDPKEISWFPMTPEAAMPRRRPCRQNIGSSEVAMATLSHNLGAMSLGHALVDEGGSAENATSKSILIVSKSSSSSEAEDDEEEQDDPRGVLPDDTRMRNWKLEQMLRDKDPRVKRVPKENFTSDAWLRFDVLSLDGREILSAACRRCYTVHALNNTGTTTRLLHHKCPAEDENNNQRRPRRRN